MRVRGYAELDDWSQLEISSVHFIRETGFGGILLVYILYGKLGTGCMEEGNYPGILVLAQTNKIS